MTSTDPAAVRSRVQFSSGGPASVARSGGGFDAYAVTSRSGPHVTMQAGVVHAGRFWTTTSRSSLKARSVRAHGAASATVSDGRRHRVLAGRTTAFQTCQPSAVLDDVTAPVRAPAAVLRLGVDRVRQLVGYLEAAGHIPVDWLPHRRALLVTKLDRSLELDGHDVVDAEGSWSADVGSRLERTEPSGGDDALPRQQLPGSHRGVVSLDGRAHVGVSTPEGPVALPARWIGQDRFHVSAPALRAVDASLPGSAAAVFDESSSRRPDEKLGVLFRGHIALRDVDGDRATVSLRTDRITTWDGFDAVTIEAGTVGARSTGARR